MNHEEILSRLEVGVSLVTWCPEDMARSEWVYVNEARCRMAGYSRDELLCIPPINITTRESIAQTRLLVEQLRAQEHLTIESTLRHKSSTAIPVVMNMTLLRSGRSTFVLVEHLDIRAQRETEARLGRILESTKDMLTLIEKEKLQIAKNIENNLGFVTMPLIDQIRIDASDAQKELLDLLEDRIRSVTRELGIVAKVSTPEAKLTRRQILISEMIRDGMTSKDIARALDCAPSTINNHRNIIRKKLGLAGRADNLQTFLNRKV